MAEGPTAHGMTTVKRFAIEADALNHMRSQGFSLPHYVLTDPRPAGLPDPSVVALPQRSQDSPALAPAQPARLGWKDQIVCSGTAAASSPPDESHVRPAVLAHEMHATLERRA